MKKNLRPPMYIGNKRMILDGAEFLLEDFGESEGAGAEDNTAE